MIQKFRKLHTVIIHTACSVVWNKEFTVTPKKFRQINSLVKRYFHEFFCQKSVRVNFRIFHTVYLSYCVLVLDQSMYFLFLEPIKHVFQCKMIDSSYSCEVAFFREIDLEFSSNN